MLLVAIVAVSLIAGADDAKVINPQWPPIVVRSCDTIPVADSYDFDAKDAIADSADVFSSATYDAAADATLQNVAFQYFSSPWRGDFIAGYGIYAMIRAAVQHRAGVMASADTRFYIGCVLRDIRLHPETSMSMSCGGLGNSCAEEYMGRALAFAAHDAWYQSYNQQGVMYANVDNAFDAISWTSSPSQYSWMVYYISISEPYYVLFNHQTESPVYAMLTIGHLQHIRKIYMAAGLTAPSFTYLASQIEGTMDWMQTKIDPATFELEDAACGHASDPWNEVCNCADRPEYTSGVMCNSGGIERHPKYYPLLTILDHIGVASWARWPWNASGFVLDQCSMAQGEHNYIFNCLFL
jgi:hypothetical protein